MNRFFKLRPRPRWLFGSRQPKRSSMPLRWSIRPTLEQLETRLMPATFNPVDTAGLIAALQSAAGHEEPGGLSQRSPQRAGHRSIGH
jgi:hypothetical protein